MPDIWLRVGSARRRTYANVRSMKKCSSCGVEKHLTDFYYRKDGITPYSHCKVCQNHYGKQHYRKNVPKYMAKARTAQRRYDEWFSNIKASLFCNKCGESDAICLDFHHVGGVKEGTVSQIFARYGRKKVLAEMAKCVVLCANCHRKEHRDLRARSTTGPCTRLRTEGLGVQIPPCPPTHKGPRRDDNLVF